MRVVREVVVHEERGGGKGMCDQSESKDGGDSRAL